MAKQEAAPAADGAAPPAKRARTALSLHEKAVVKSFCEQRAAESKARGELAPSQDQLRAEVAARFGWRCGRSTLSKIVAMDWQLLQRGALQNPNMKRQRRPLFPAFESDLVAFIAAFLDAQQPKDAAQPQVGDRKPVLTEALILEEAQRLKQVHGIREEQLVLSVGWLARFKHRHGIRLRKSANGGARSDVDATGGSLTTAKASVSDAVNWNAVDPLFLSTASVMEGLGGMGDPVGSAASLAVNKDADGRSGDAELLQTLEATSTSTDGRNSSMTAQASSSTLCRLAFNDPGFPKDILDKIPEVVRTGARPCGCSQLRGLGREHLRGLRIVLYGSNSTVDAFVAADYVGESGSVACIDVRSASRELGSRCANQYLQETLHYPIADGPALLTFSDPDSDLASLQGAADLVLLDCSVQSLGFSEMEKHLSQAVTLLKPGGELRVSLVCSSRRLRSPVSSSSLVTESEHALAATFGSLPGATVEQLLTTPYYIDICLLLQRLRTQVDTRAVAADFAIGSSKDGMSSDPFDTKFYACIFRLFAIESLEQSFEDYGHVAIYNGDSPAENEYRLDHEFVFPKGEPIRVDGNTAQVLRTSWLRSLFTVEGDTSVHRGRSDRRGCHYALPRNELP